MTVDKGETLEPIALGEAGEEGVGEVGAKEEEVETADEASVGEGLIDAGEDAHHLDEGGETGEGGPVPEELDGALAPGAGDEEGVVEVTLGVEVLEDVYEDLWGEMGHGGMGVGGRLGVVTCPLCGAHDGGEGGGEQRRFGWIVVVVVGEGRRRLCGGRVAVDEPHASDRRRLGSVGPSLVPSPVRNTCSIWLSHCPHLAPTTLLPAVPAGSPPPPPRPRAHPPPPRRVSSVSSHTQSPTPTPSGAAASTRSGRASSRDTGSSTVCQWASWCAHPHHSAPPP